MIAIKYLCFISPPESALFPLPTIFDLWFLQIWKKMWLKTLFEDYELVGQRNLLPLIPKTSSKVFLSLLIMKKKKKVEGIRTLEKILQYCCCCWVAKPCLTLYDFMNCSTPGFSVLHYLLAFAQTYIHWINDAIQPSHPLLSPFSSCPQSFPASGSFPMSQLFPLGGQSIGASASASVLLMNIQYWLPLGLTGLTLAVQGLSRVFSVPQFQSISSSVLSLLCGPTLISVMTAGKPQL